MKKRLEQLVEKYGKIAVVTWFVIYALFLVGGMLAIKTGFGAHGAAASTGAFGASWVANRATLPIRFGLTALLTPLVARVWWKFRPPEKKDDSPLNGG